MKSRHAASFLMTLLAAAAPVGATVADNGETAFRALYKELVEINTTLSAGSCTIAAEAMARHLRAVGWPAADMQVLVPREWPKQGNLVATYRGSNPDAEPILLLAHLDVVEARREDWTRDPFTLTEEDGWFHARGASDDKAMAAVFVDSLVRYRKEDFRPARDIKLALTCGEETSEVFNGVSWLLEHHPGTLKAAFALNEGAGGELDANDKPIALQIQAGEKAYQDFTLEITDPGGHSSRPKKANPIYRLSAALEKIGAYRFPIRLNEVTRAYFKSQIELAPAAAVDDIKGILREPPDEAAAARLWDMNPSWNSMMRTTCVATMVSAGHAENALPQRARANVNCRILPGVPMEAVKNTLVHAMGDDGITISGIEDPGSKSKPPVLSAQVLEPARKVAESIWPGVAIVPTMSPGATDGRFLNAAGTPTYGLSGMFHDAEGSRAHGLNERIRVKSLLDGRRFLHEVVKLYANDVDG